MNLFLHSKINKHIIYRSWKFKIDLLQKYIDLQIKAFEVVKDKAKYWFL